jgi:phage terminase large subunit GpA-like protein
MEITGVFGGTGRDKRKTFVSASIQNKYGQNQRELNVNEGKTLIDNHIKNGRVHFSKHPSFTEDFFRGLTAEQFNPDTQSWEKPDYAHNEPFDLINYNLATFYIYTDGRPVEWDDYKNWNKNGCNVIVENETEGIVSKGIEF